MKTVYYTFTTWEESAPDAGPGGAAKRRRSLTASRPAWRGRDNVTDLSAWRADHTAPAEEEDLTGGPGDEAAPPAPRSRRDRRRALFAAELLSTLAVAGATAALLLRALLL